MDVFTSEELRNLAAQASTIDERLAGGYIAKDTPAAAEKAARRVKAWCKSATDGDEGLFRKRLAQDGLDIDRAILLLGHVGLAEDWPTPVWVETFSWALDVMRSPGGVHSPVRFVNPDQPLPFEDVFVPLVAAARERRHRLIATSSELFSETAHAMLQGSLLRRLSELCAPTLYEGFSLFQMIQQPMMMVFVSPSGNPGSRTAYDDYIAELRARGLRDYFLNRPVLARLLATVVEQWIEGTAELIARLNADLAEICEIFLSGAEPSSVTAVDYGLSDPHNNGRTVCLLTFADGLKLVYKPKDLGLDVAWGKLLCWLDARGAPPSARALTVLQREGYGWGEWIEPAPCADEAHARRFFRCAGSMLCLLHLFQGTDFHFENVIANGDRPSLVDLETLMHPWLLNPFPTVGPKAAIAAATERLRESVLATGYLPNWVVVRGGRVAGIGGLNPTERHQFKLWIFQNINTDAMKLGKVSEIIEARPHLPSLDGKQLSSAAYRDEIVAGFEMMYHFLLDNRIAVTDPAGPLSAFKGQTVRVILRPTQLYALLLRRSLEGQNLSDGADWSLHFDFISRFSRWAGDEESLPLVQSAERDALVRLDIPFFTTRTDSSTLQLPNGRTIAKYFQNPSLEDIGARLQRVSETESQTQIAFVLQALEGVGSHENLGKDEPWEPEVKSQPSKGCLTFGMAVDQARAFAATLEREAVCAGVGAAWVGASPLPGEQRSQLAVIGYDLYSGASGVALFLAAFERVTGVDHHHDLALAALAPLREELCGSESGPRLARTMGIGGGTGLGSVIYALVRSATLLNEEGLLEDAQCAASLITDERIAADYFLDVISGTAGAVLGLLALHQACHDDSVLERAIACGHHLLVKQGQGVAGKKTWQTIGEMPLAGLSHGAAGIALALLRLYEATRDRAFLDAALGGIGYERSVFVAEAGNWPDFRELPCVTGEPVYPCQWCHGATGIGLARLGGLKILDDSEIRGEINIALQTTCSFPMGALDHLCCGNFGRLELPFSAGRHLGRGKLVDLARYRAAQLLDRAKKARGFRWPSGTDLQNPGFFIGISGVGYQLLRLTRPEVLPSVLLWE